MLDVLQSKVNPLYPSAFNWERLKYVWISLQLIKSLGHKELSYTSNFCIIIIFHNYPIIYYFFPATFLLHGIMTAPLPASNRQVDTVMVHEINHREDDDSITLEQRKIPQPPKIGVFQSKDDRADPLERLSFIMGKFLLKGFKMLNVTCEKCEVRQAN